MPVVLVNKMRVRKNDNNSIILGWNTRRCMGVKVVTKFLNRRPVKQK